MSDTRHAAAGSPLRQERWASSADLPRGIMANLVAKRCAVVESPADRALLWWVQWRSLQPGGLGARKDELAELALNPAAPLDSALADEARAERDGWIDTQGKAFVFTQIGRQIFAALDYALATRSLVVIDGSARTGKTTAAKAWVARQAGAARFVQVPPTNDDKGFFRAMAVALGVSVNLNSKALELRERVEEVLHGGDLMLVLDEADYCWPVTNQHYAMPQRVCWVLSEICNYNLPVALVARPEFYRTLRLVEKRSGWESSQFIGRIGHAERLPDRLSSVDLRAVAKSLLPEADAKTLGALAAYALISRKHLASLDTLARRARYLAHLDGRQTVTVEDVKRAMREGVIPSDTALDQALKPKPAKARQAPFHRPASLPANLPADPRANRRFSITDLTGIPA